MIVTPGEAVRKQAIERFRLRSRPRGGRAGSRRAVVPPRGAAARERAPYFLFVGTLEPRKNLPALVEAWREVRRHHAIDLVLAGRRRADAPPSPRNRVCASPAKSPTSNSPELYSGALALVYPRCMKVSACRCWRPCSAAPA